MKRSAILLLLASVLSIATTAQTALSDEQARALTIDHVAKTTSISKGELNTRRLEEVEDDLFSFQTKISGQIRKGAYFYRVEDGGWHISSPTEATYSSHSLHVWYVAISTAADHEAFGLLGFKDADTTFQHLVSRIPMQVRNASEATHFARFYLKTVYGRADNIVYDELSLRHHVEEHFIGYADSQEPVARKEQRFRNWWNGYKAKSIGSLQPSANAEGTNRYKVVMKILEMTVGLQPELSQWSVEVQSDGATRLLSKQPVFPGSLKGTKSTTRPAQRNTAQRD